MSNHIFSRLDDLTPLQAQMHDVMLLNECKNGQAAYKLSYAEKLGSKDNPKSGLSFGWNQFDLANNKDARTIFIDILKKAEDKQGHLIFPNDRLEDIDKKISIKGKNAEQIFGKELANTIERALQSEYEREKIDESYLEYLQVKESFLDNLANKITNPLTAELLKTDEAKLAIFDYDNQFNIDPNGPLIKFLKDGYYQFESKREAYINEPSIKSIHDFIRQTEQYNKAEWAAKNLENRFNNQVLVTAKHNKVQQCLSPLVKHNLNHFDNKPINPT